MVAIKLELRMKQWRVPASFKKHNSDPSTEENVSGNYIGLYVIWLLWVS